MSPHRRTTSRIDSWFLEYPNSITWTSLDANETVVRAPFIRSAGFVCMALMMFVGDFPWIPNGCMTMGIVGVFTLSVDLVVR
jgi:hypothetical protein